MSAADVQLTRPVLRSARGVVSCSSPAAVSAAIEMLQAGGSAVDAMVAAALALSVVQPHACGLGGDAMILVGGREETVAINGSGEAPAGVTTLIPRDGGGTAAVPGFVAGVLDAHERFGRLPRERLFAPAVRLASAGFAVGEELLSALRRQRTRLARTSVEWPLTAPTIGLGSIARLPRLAQLLTAVADQGSAAFYSGGAAAAVARAVKVDGGTMTGRDLEAYSAIVCSPVGTDFAGARIEVNPPTSQGILLLVALNQLARHSTRGAAAVERIQHQTEAIETSFSYRSEVAHEDAEARLLAPSGQLEPPVELTGGHPRGYNHTSAIAVADERGQVASALVSLFDDFGSATFVPELQIHLNSRLLGFDEQGRNVPAPRRRPVHTLAPAIVRTPERVIGIATPGADGQVQTLLQVLTSVLEDAVPVQEALHHARWRLVEDEIVVELGFSETVIAALRGQGRTVRVLPAGDQLFGAVSAVAAPSAGGAVEAMSDPRREVWAAVA